VCKANKTTKILNLLFNYVFFRLQIADFGFDFDLLCQKTKILIGHEEVF
jgi:hypothetical protein